jgi:hypothetical protein
MANMPNFKMNICRMIEALPENEALMAGIFIEFISNKMKDPFFQFLLTAEPDLNEPPLTEEALAQIEESNRAIERGEGIPWEEFRKELLGNE